MTCVAKGISIMICIKNFCYLFFVVCTVVLTCSDLDYDIEFEREYAWVYSTNLLDLDSLVNTHYIMCDGTTGDDDNLSYTNYIPVVFGDTIILGKGINDRCFFRFVTAYDSNKIVLNECGQEQIMEYAVLPDVSYVRVSIYDEDIDNTTRINKGTQLLRYEPFSLEYLPSNTYDKRLRRYMANNMPLTTKGLIHALSYSPITELTKGYFCLMSDDGYEGVATYSIPMIIEKNVPMTFAVMKGSPVLSEPYLDIVKDAIENHGCSLAHHGFRRYTEFNEDQLNYFFDLEDEFFDSLGLNIYGAVCPSHNIDETVAAVAGHRYHVVRSGYSAGGGDLMPTYDWYMNGRGSNIHALNSINISTEPVEDQFAHIDACKENNLLLIGFYHEWELDDAKKTKIESIIDYAKEKGLEFITFDQIPCVVYGE